jgi:chitinase
MWLYLLSHLFLRMPEASRFVDRWAPQAVVGQLVSASGVNDYVRAKLYLQKGDGIFVQEKTLHVFVVGNVTVEENKEAYVVHTCLWNGRDVDRAACVRDLIEWADASRIEVLPGPLVGGLF